MSDSEKETIEIFKRMARFLYEEDEEVRPIEEIRAELALNEVDTGPTVNWAQERIAQAQAEARLASARAQRLAKLEAFEKIKGKLAEGAEAVRTEIQARIAALGSADSEAALMWGRKFEDATDSDLQGFLEDLTMLEEDA